MLVVLLNLERRSRILSEQNARENNIPVVHLGIAFSGFGAALETIRSSQPLENRKLAVHSRKKRRVMFRMAP